MQITRLFEITYRLLEGDGQTAASLAEQLGVSIRTIYRDIDALSAAGIPIYCERGRGGGVRLLPGFTLSRSMLSEGEQRGILAALEALSATGERESAAALQKLAAVFRRDSAAWVAIDFADWGQSSAQRLDTLKQAVLEKQVIAFDYYGVSGGHQRRTAEPLQLWFKHRAWYLRAWCRTRQAPRLFKLARMRQMSLLGESFTRTLSPDDFAESQGAGPPPPITQVVLHMAASCAYRVYDEFDDEAVERLPDGSFRVRARFIVEDWLVGYILSFGPAVRVEAPDFLREEIRRRLLAMREIYAIE